MEVRGKLKVGDVYDGSTVSFKLGRGSVCFRFPVTYELFRKWLSLDCMETKFNLNGR